MLQGTGSRDGGGEGKEGDVEERCVLSMQQLPRLTVITTYCKPGPIKIKEETKIKHTKTKVTLIRTVNSAFFLNFYTQIFKIGTESSCLHDCTTEGISWPSGHPTKSARNLGTRVPPLMLWRQVTGPPDGLNTDQTHFSNPGLNQRKCL